MKLARLALAVWFSVAALVPGALPVSAANDARTMYSEPAIAPDGSEIAFISGGDIWTVPVTGGIARLLVASVGSASRPIYSPDGKRIAFTATKNGGAGDAYVLTLDTGDLKRLTFDDGRSDVSGWSHDGMYVYFASAKNNIFGKNDIFRVPASGGTPSTVVGERYFEQTQGAPSRDGSTLAYKCGGFGQWWRRGHVHIDESAICTKRIGGAAYAHVTPGDSVEQWPMWGPDDRTIYYVSDRTGAANLWAQPLGGKGRALTQFTNDRVLYPSIDSAAKTIVFERDFGIWTYDVASGNTKALAIVRRGLPADVTPQHVTLTNGFRGLAVAPDAKKVAFVARGQVFAASAVDGGEAVRVTKADANAQEPTWASDSRRLAYISDADGLDHVYLYDFKTNAETRITEGALGDAYPNFSPDGKKLAYDRDGHELHIRDLETKADTIVARGYLASRPPINSSGAIAWSPAGDALAFVAIDGRGFETVHVAHTDGRAEQQVGFIANGNVEDLTWSPDATRIYYITGQRTEAAQVVQIDLFPRKPLFREDRFRDLFNEEPTRRTPPQPAPVPSASSAPATALATMSPAPAASGSPAGKRTTVVLENIRERATVLPVGVDADGLAITNDGKTLVLTASAAGQQNVYSFNVDELAREQPIAKQLTATTGGKASLQVARDGKDAAYILDQGRVAVVNLADGRVRPIAIVAELDADISKDKMEMFAQAWRATNETFFSPTFNGVDWNAVRTQYEPYIRGARTYDEVRRLLNMMDGELNASHMGAGAPRNARRTEGNLGVAFDAAEIERTGHLKLTEIVNRGPVALAGTVKLGDTLVAIDGHAIGQHENVDELLQNTIGKRTQLTFENERGKREVAVLPVSDGEVGQLRYRDWVESRRAIVTKASGGRIGYVHIADMSSAALDQLYLDLDAENQSREGVVIDVRDNNGGFIDPYVADVFLRRDYLRFSPRNGPSSVGTRSNLGQRAFGRKTVLLTNEHSLSDAENFAEGYRALKLGKIVGEPTAGWIIFTYGMTLVDGSSYRLPRTAVTTLDNQPLERHPRPVDVRVARPLGEAATDDAQLRTAVETLLKR